MTDDLVQQIVIIVREGDQKVRLSDSVGTCNGYHVAASWSLLRIHPVKLWYHICLD